MNLLIFFIKKMQIHPDLLRISLIFQERLVMLKDMGMGDHIAYCSSWHKNPWTIEKKLLLLLEI